MIMTDSVLLVYAGGMIVTVSDSDSHGSVFS